VSRLRDEFLEKDIILFDKNATEPDTSVNLILQNIYVQILYRPVAKNILFRTSKYERSIESLLSFYIKEKDESIIYSYSKIQQMTDTLNTSQLEKVENKFLPFTSGTRLESGWVRKLFEPAVVTITTIGVVLLFYSLRSS
jgi:hypothetical protein